MADVLSDPTQQQPVQPPPADPAGGATTSWTPAPPLDENGVMQQIAAIPDKKQRIVQGIARGLVPMVSAGNDDAQLVPPSRVQEAGRSGYRRATMMSSPEEQLHLVGNDEVQQAINNHWNVGQPIKPPAAGITDPSDPGYGTDEWYMAHAPQSLVKGMQWFKKGLIDPFDAMAAAGSSALGEQFEKGAATTVTPAHRGGIMPLPHPRYPAPEMTNEELQAARENYPAYTGIARGVGETAGGMAADPRMWPLLFGGEALPVVQKLASAGFSGQMLYGAYRTYPEIKQLADSGDVEGVYRLLTHLGLSAYMGAQGGLHTVGELPQLVGPEAVAGALRESGAKDISQVLGPTTKENKAITQKIAPEIAGRSIFAWTRKGLSERAEREAEQAGQKVDQAYMALGPDERVPTQPILDHFEQSKQAFMSAEGKVLDQAAIDRVDALKQVVAQFGPDVSPGDIVKLRRLWDKQIAAAHGFYGKTVAEGSALDAKREAADAIRSELAQQYPDLDKINKEFSFWANVRKVIGETVTRKESQAPPLGETVLAAGGLAHAGAPGAAAWWGLRKVLTSTAWNTASASLKFKIADLLADGKTEQAATLAGQQLKIPFPEGPLWDINQTPAPPEPTPQRALPPGPPAQGRRLAEAQPIHPMPPSPLGAAMQPIAGQLGPGAEPPAITSPSRMLGPARLPQSIVRPTPGLEAPTAPSSSAEAAAVQRAAEQGRGPGAQTPTPSENVAPAAPESPQGPIPRPLRSALRAGQTVGSAESTRLDNEFLQQAKRERPDGSVSQWLQRAQELKQQAQQAQPSPLGGVPLFSRPLVAPPEGTSQLDLGLNLPRRGEPFFSKAEQIADQKLPKSGNGDSFLATLRNNGVKAEEMADLHLDDFAGKAKVTKQEFLDAIRSRRPQLEQTTLEDERGETSYEGYRTPGGKNYRETLTQYPRSEAGQRAEALKAEISQRKQELDDEIDRHNAASAERQAQWPDDYFDKERAAISHLQVQLRDAETEARRTDYQSGHWVEHPNVMAHSRESDFTTTDGMPVRHVHEIQSDLHQLGREGGYRSPALRQLPEGYKTERMSGGGFRVVDPRGRVATMPGDATDIASFPGAGSPEDAIDAYIGRANAAQRGSAPDVPFKKSWHELAVKDSIRRAIDDGQQGMTWDTGATQADRYDLSKHVSRVEYDPDTQTLMARDPSGKKVIDENVKPEDIHKYIGKEAAEKLHHQIENYYPPSSEEDYSITYDPEGETYHVFDQNGERIGEEETHRDAQRMVRDYVDNDYNNRDLPTLRGLDLKVGGEGMQGFYDKMIPDFVRKYTKKWGAKVDTAEIPTGDTQKEHEYVGPELTKDQVEQRWKASARKGPMEWKKNDYAGGAWAWYQDGKQISGAFHDASDSKVAAQTISNDPVERQWKSVLDDMNRGVPFKDTMANNWNLAEEVGGKIQTNENPVTTKVHRLTFTPEMVDAVKSEGQPLYQRSLEAATQQPLFAKGSGVSGAKALETLRAANEMKPSIDEGGPDRAARLHIDDATYKLLQNLVPGGGDWLGVNFHESDARNIARMLRGNADALEPTGQTTAVANMRRLADLIDRAHGLNFDPNAPGHGGVPIVKDLSSEAHEAQTHVGQRALSPTSDVIDYTNVDKTVDHPVVRKAWPALERIGATSHPGLAVAELEAHLLDGSHEFFGLSKDEAVQFLEHARTVMREHHSGLIQDPPRLAKGYLDSIDRFIEEHRAQPTEAAAETAQPGRTPEVAGENGGAGEPTGRAGPQGNRAAGDSEEVTPPRPLFSKADAKRVSTRNPTAKGATEDPLKSDLQINTQAIRDSGRADAIATLLSQYPGNANLSPLDTEGKLAGFQRNGVRNLLFMHDQYPEEFRNVSKNWYDGANKLATRVWPREYGITDAQGAGGLAAISPKLEWNKNIGIEQRMIEAMQQQNDLKYTPKMAATAKEWIAATKPEKRAATQAMLRQLAGKRLGELETPLQKATWIHLYQEAEGDPHYNMYAPDGSVVGPARTQKGQGPLASLGWAMDGNVAKAVSILEDGSRANISKQLGIAHKIRSFYNNLIAPNSRAGDVTVDTHAVAADQIRPLGMNSPEVGHNFDGPGSDVTGVHGTYGVHADAYRDAAAQRDLLPRQMQSITWDNARSVFPREFKTPANNAIIDAIWREYDRGIRTIGQTRRAIIDAAGGWKPPDWAGYQPSSRSRSYSGRTQEARPASQPGKLPSAGISRPERSPAVTGGGSSAPAGTPAAAKPAVTVRGTGAVGIPAQLKRVMKR
jgi:hypothetical protein